MSADAAGQGCPCDECPEETKKACLDHHHEALAKHEYAWHCERLEASRTHGSVSRRNWEMPAEGRRLTAGQRLAEHVRRAVDIAREVAPKAALYLWSDMFDPNHNARDGYYLVNGTFAGSWEGLAKDVVIVPWYFGQRDASLKWFADRGHKQVIAGYYDSRPERVRDWLTSAGKVDGVIGMMYTTWRQRYDDLEAFLGAVNGFEPSPHVGRGGS